MQRFLVQHYDRVICTASEAEGLGYLRAQPGAVVAVVTALRFGGRLENLEYLAELDKAAAGAPVVVASGAEPTEEEAAWFAEHAVAYLPKPFEASDLLRALEQAAGRRGRV